MTYIICWQLRESNMDQIAAGRYCLSRQNHHTAEARVEGVARIGGSLLPPILFYA